MGEGLEKPTIKDRLSPFAQRAGRVLTKRNQGILFLVTLVFVALAILDAVDDLFPEPVSITLYVLAAVGFVTTCALWVKAVAAFVASVVLPFTRSNRVANALLTNTRLRAVLTSVPGMGFSLVYALFNGVVGIVARSAWYGSLSAYYLLLCAMRFLSVSYARRMYAKDGQDDGLEERELKVYRNCGIMLAVSSIALGGAVIMVVMGDGGTSYPGLMIYAVATYTFYRLTMAIINMVKARKERSLLLTTLRNISYSDSLVSLLSLQTALFAAFGQDAGAFVPTMNALTGAAVCLMIAGLGICMAHDARRHRGISRAGEETRE